LLMSQTCISSAFEGMHTEERREGGGDSCFELGGGTYQG